MTLETDVLAAISLAGIAKTVIFVVGINFFCREERQPEECNID